MLTINAKLEGHRLTITGTPQLAADSARVDRVKFDFDDEWTGFSRVALFWGSDGEEPYAVAVDGQGYAVIPWETIQEKGRMRFGVYGIKGTSRITSTVLKYQIQDGAWSASPANPGEITPTMLEQLQTLVETAVEQMDDRLAEFDAAVETFFPHRGGVGALVTVEGTVDASPAGLTIYGRSVQDGTPAPDALADIVTAGSGGTLAMVSAGKNLAYMTRGSINYATGAEEVNNQATRTGFIPVMGPRLYCTKSTAFASGSAYSLNARCYAADFSYIGTVRLMDGEVLESYVTVQYNETLKNAAYIRFVQFYPDSTTTPEGINLMIAFGDTSSVSYPEYVRASSISSAIPTPNGLPGIPVASGGNYTDTDGQMWICDTIDLEAGVWVKRVGIFTLNGEYIPQTVSTMGSYTRFWYQVGTVSIAPASGTMCSHAPYDTSGYDEARLGFGISASYPRNIWAKLPTATVGSTAETIRTWMQNNPMTLVAALVEPVVEPLTEAQIAAQRALRGRKGLTNLYSADPAGPEFRAEMYIDIPTYIAGLMG